MQTLISLLFTAVGVLALKECTISLKDASLPTPPPLLLNPTGTRDVFGFIQPSDSLGKITLNAGDRILLACPGPLNYIVALQPTPVKKSDQLVQEATVTCAPGNVYRAGGNRTHALAQLNCKIAPHHVAKKTTTVCKNNKNAPIGVMVDIGFQINAGFYKVIDVCFDESKRNPIYSRYDMVAAVKGGETKIPGQAYLPGNPTFYPGIKIEDIYKRISQNSSIINNLITTSPSRNHVLSKGRLASSLNFVFRPQKRSTFYYVNSAPQWESIRDNNWNPMKATIRAYADKHKVNLEVYTGTHAILESKTGKELYLHDEGPGKQFVPIPKYFWMIVINRKTNAGVAIISENNPFLTRSVPICPDISASVPWVKWDKTKPEWGFIYCCEVNAFKPGQGYLPSTVPAVTRLLV